MAQLIETSRLAVLGQVDMYFEAIVSGDVSLASEANVGFGHQISCADENLTTVEPLYRREALAFEPCSAEVVVHERHVNQSVKMKQRRFSYTIPILMANG